MKYLYTLIAIVILSTCGQAQLHRTVIGTPQNYDERGLDVVCKPCQGNQLLLSQSTGAPGSSTDDWLQMQLTNAGSILASARFPEPSSITPYSRTGDAVGKRIMDSTETVCQGYLIAFTARVEDTADYRYSGEFETHILRMDANLNQVWHHILFNNQGYSTRAEDLVVDHVDQTAVVLMNKGFSSMVVAEIDLASGFVISSQDIAHVDPSGATLPTQGYDIEAFDWSSSSKYGIIGTVNGRLSLTTLSSTLGIIRALTYDVDGDGTMNESGVSLQQFDGDIMMTGIVTESSPFGILSYTFLMRVQVFGLSPSQLGAVRWMKRIAAPSNGTRVEDMVAAPDGSGVILAGRTRNFEVGFPIGDKGTPFMTKYDGSGNHLWTREYHAGSQDQGELNAVDVNGSVICACGSAWPALTTYEYDVLDLATDAQGVINASCDTMLHSTDASFNAIRINSSGTSSTLTSPIADIITNYPSHTYDMDSCYVGPPAVVSGMKWIDEDCDGTLNGSETVTSGWVIELRDASGRVLQTATTDVSGAYSFSVFVDGTHYITEQNLPGYNRGTPAMNAPHVVQVTLGQSYTGLDFGNCPCDDIIGYNPTPQWYDPMLRFPDGIYTYDIVEFDGRIIGINQDNEIHVWDDVLEKWNLAYTHNASAFDLTIFDNKLFVSGANPVWFDQSIYNSISPTANTIPSLGGLHVLDYEVMGNKLYAAGYGGVSNIYVTNTGTPNFTATPFPNSAIVDQLGAFPNQNQLVVVGSFGTSLGSSQNITFFNPITGATSALGTQGLNGYLPPTFEDKTDIIALGNEIHVGGRFTEISDGTTVVPGTRGYAIFDAGPFPSPGSGSWRTNTGTNSGGPWDMDLYQGHIYIVGFYTDIAGTTHDRGVVYDGATYHPLNNTYASNVLYAENVQPSGLDKLVCATEFPIEFAVCGGSNCTVYMPDDSICPGEPYTFQPYLSFASGTYAWDFGDGNTSTQQQPSHTYILPGSYTVTLDYDDGSGCSGQETMTMDVVNRPDCNFITNPMPWEKIYGDSTDNRPVKIKRTPFNEILVLGNIPLDDSIQLNKGTLSKFDASTGALIWHFEASGLEPIGFRDIEFNLTTREYLIVGHTLTYPTGVNQDNKSVMIKVTDFGATYQITSSPNAYDQLGREYFEEITRHEFPDTASNGFDFYFTGARNFVGSNPPPPSHRDEHTLGNTDINRTLGTSDNWYEFTVHQTDDEYQRGLFTIPTGEVICVGTSYPSGNNYGAIFEFDPLTGNYVNGIQLLDIIDLYHGISHSSTIPTIGELYLVVGEHFGSGDGLIALIDNDANSVLDAVRIPELGRLEEVHKDQFGEYYVVGQSRDPSANGRPVVVKFHIDEMTSPTNTWQINMNWAKYLDDGETSYDQAHIYVDHRSDFIYYVDGRRDNPRGYDLTDMLVMVADLDMTSVPCISDTTVTFNHFSIPTSTIVAQVFSEDLPLHGTQDHAVDLNYLCNDFCTPPCVVDWTWQQDDCYGVDFSSILDTGLTLPATYEWDIDGNGSIEYTTAHPYHDFMTAGMYYVCLSVYDSAGVLCDTHCDSVNVGPDTRLPTITCPPNIFRSIQVCDRGINVHFNLPTAWDCADSLTVTCSHQSGDFFTCGNTLVTCSATDQEGNTVQCSFNVQVGCSCTYMQARPLTCTDSADTYAFDVDVIDNTGSGNQCSPPTLSTNQSGVTLTVLTQTQIANGWNVTGTLYAPVCPALNSFSIRGDMSCICPDGDSVHCSTSISLPAVCCDSVYIDDVKVCSDGRTLELSPSYFGMVKDIDQMNWYVMPSDTCSDSLFTDVPFQSSLDSRDLHVAPTIFGGKLCYQVEVLLGDDEGPCDYLRSEVSCIELCDPPACQITPNQEYCYAGPPIFVNPITYTYDSSACDYSIEWYEITSSGRYPLANSGQLSYQPPPLVMPNINDCEYTVTYEVELVGPCDTSYCRSTITLYSDDANLGDIYITSGDSLPLCYGEDISMLFKPYCQDGNATWSWFYNNVSNPSFVPLPGAGTRNTIINSNPLYESTTYRVEIQNGVCPVKNVELFVPVKDSMQIGTLTASFVGGCRRGGVNFSLPIPSCVPGGALCDCNYDVQWYRDDQLIFQKVYTSAPATYQYIDPSVLHYGGNYQAVVTDLCCGDTLRSNVIQLLPPPEMVLVGPCYMCDTLLPITISSIINYPMPTTTTYQWYQVVAGTDIQLSGENGPTLSTNQPGLYKLIAKWSSTCFVEAYYHLRDCTRNSLAVYAMSLANGSYHFQTSNRGPQVYTPDGTLRGITVNSAGQLTTVPCWPTNPPDPHVKMASHDVLVESASHGVVFDHLDALGAPTTSILTVDNSGQLWFNPLTSTAGNHLTIEAGVMEFESQSTGVILTSPNGKHWRVVIDLQGDIQTESVTPQGY